jgi:putative transposase
MSREKLHRRSIRLKGYDYTRPGGYFVTIRTQNGIREFGDIVNGKMVLNASGKIVESEWLRTTDIRPYVELDAYCVMPDHFHGIIFIHDISGKIRPMTTTCDVDGVVVGATRRVAPTSGDKSSVDQSTHHIAPTDDKPSIDQSNPHTASAGSRPCGPKPCSLGAVIGQFKSMSAKRINRLRGNPDMILWQRNYYDRIIRNDDALFHIREYIRMNPPKMVKTSKKRP